MVRVNDFYIDSTEVTVAQYAAFEKAKGADWSGQPAECAWNTSYDSGHDPAEPTAGPNQPITNVDFCDALAFCSWADKRVCGKVGGGALALPELADATKSQWFAACAGPHGQAYPYGTTYKAGRCNDASGVGHLLDVGATAVCEGYYPGLLDMLGNAQEWTDTCNDSTGRHDGCEAIGGSYRDTSSCGQSGLKRRDLQAPELGFRCCSK
jgi:formylglycine-generating enzyme required for sulfatase activity